MVKLAFKRSPYQAGYGQTCNSSILLTGILKRMWSPDFVFTQDQALARALITAARPRRRNGSEWT